MKRNMPPLNSLRAFEAAARLGSFVAAGKELHVTPAAVSHQVKELESTLRIELFQRLPRGVKLTEAGRCYRDEVAQALTQIAKATAAITETVIDGPIRVSLPQSFAQLWLAPRLNALSRRFPELEPSFDGSSHLVDLRGGEADIAIRFGAGHYPGLHSQLLLRDWASLLVATDRLARTGGTGTRKLLQETVLLEDQQATPNEPWQTWDPWLRDCLVTRESHERRIRFSDSAMAISACVAGAGVCIGRTSLAMGFIRRRQITALVPWRSTDFAYYLVTRESDVDNPRIRAFREWMHAEVAVFLGDAIKLTGDAST